MKIDLLEKILAPILERYMNVNIDSPQGVMLMNGMEIKERIGVVRNMRIVIYPNDHDPPHFHVISNDNTIDAKFKIENCALISGTISKKDIKRIRAFYKSPKTIVVMRMIWDKRN